MKRNVEKKEIGQYLKEAQSWETSAVLASKRSERFAWRVATGAGVAAILAIGAVAGLTPLKTVSPYVIRVDNSTGRVDIVEAMTNSKTTYDEAVNKYFSGWYVRYREGYSRALAEDYYSNVGLLSSTPESQRYFAAFNPKNPASPLNVYGATAQVKVEIKSVSFINDKVALVRFTKLVERANTQPEVSHWTATITFRYSKAPVSEKDREINPLGFQVDEYRVDPDAGMDAAQASPQAIQALPVKPVGGVVLAPTAQTRGAGQ